jgi:hypothetical protein
MCCTSLASSTILPRRSSSTLLDEGIYLASVRTFYRILAARQEVRERRNLRQHPRYQAPELLATTPNQVWSHSLRSGQALGHHQDERASSLPTSSYWQRGLKEGCDGGQPSERRKGVIGAMCIILYWESQDE